MNVLHCTSLGESMLPEFIRRLQAAGQTGVAGRTALVLPSPYLLEQARNRLRLTDVTAWEFPRILSLDELAAHLAGLRKISRLEQEVLIGGIVRETVADGKYPYFAGIVDYPGFIASLSRLFDEFKLAAVTPDELTTAIDALQGEVERNTDRDAAIVALFQAYQERLTELSLTDLGGMYAAAVEKLAQSERRLPFERIFMAEFSVLSPLRLELVARLQRRTEMEIGICFEKNRPGAFRSVEPVYQALVGMGFRPKFHSPIPVAVPALQHLRQELLVERPKIVGDAAGIAVLCCPNRAKELTVVADRIKALLLAEEINPKSVAVVVQDPALYPRLRAVFAERGIPVDRADVAPVSGKALPRLVAAWLRLVRGRGDRDSLIAFLKLPYVAGRLDWDGDSFEQALLDEVIRHWEAWPAALARRAPDGATQEAWRDKWHELRQRAQEWEQPATWTEWADRLRGLLSWLELPAQLRRLRRAGTLSLAEVRAELQCLEAILAVAATLAGLTAIAPADEGVPGLAELDEMLRQLLGEATVALEERQAAGVQVVTPETGSGMNFRAVFVLGLAEGEFPAPPRESWLYGDRERQTLGEAGVLLRTAQDRAAAADFSFALAAAMATERLCLSALQDSETLPSRFVNEVTRLFAAGAVPCHSFTLAEVVAAEPSQVWSLPELVKAGLHHAWTASAETAEWTAVFAALPALLPAGLAERARVEAERTGVYAGKVARELMDVDRFSPSALEQYADCPFAYFAATVMDLGEWQPAAEGFDVLSAGSVWHEVLAMFMGRYRGRFLQAADRQHYEAELSALLAAAVARRERQGRLATDVWWRFEQPRWQQALCDWLDGELARQEQQSQWRPSYFEWAFGAPPRPGSDPASSEQPLLLMAETGERVEIQGKIDRIDVDGGRLRVIDYKTGKPPARKQLEQGLRLQVPLYMLAVAQQLGGQDEAAVEGLYLQVGKAAAELGISGGKMSQADLLALTREAALRYAAGIRDGNFAAQPSAGCQDWCPARRFCRRSADSTAETEGATDE